MNTQDNSGAITVRIDPGKWVLAPIVVAAKGYSLKAIDRKRQEGHWIENEQWIKAPDGRILYSIEGIDKWAEKGQGLR